MNEIRREPLLIAQLFIHKEKLAAKCAGIVHAGEPDEGAVIRARSPEDGVGPIADEDAGVG